MHRMTVTLCLSLSLAAASMAAFALFRNGSGSEQSDPAKGEDLHEVRQLLSSLQDKVEGVEARLAGLERAAGSIAGPGSERQPGPIGDPSPLEEQVEGLSQRLASLEDEETIARLARSGQIQAREKELRSALEEVGDRDAAAATRLAALRRIRRAGKMNGSMVARAMSENGMSERDVVLPMLELAQDTRLDSDLRADVVRGLIGSRVEELRRPMLDLLAFDRIPEVRAQAIDVLIYHARDRAVREAITRASLEDPHDEVRLRATSRLPKVEWFARQDAGEEE